jgi:hypothetical protein
MSYVTDIIILCSLRERYSNAGERRDMPTGILGINAWLKSRQHAPLVALHDYIGMKSEKAFQAEAYGGALNFLEIPSFLEAVAGEFWEIPSGLLLLLQNEDDEQFSVYRLDESSHWKKCE